MRVTFSVDVEDHGAGPARAAENTRRLMGFLGDRGISGTFFMVGTLARIAPDLVRAIARAGHEVACHGHAHIRLERVSRGALQEALSDTKARLEDLAGQAVGGFRAPEFSLTPGVPWVPGVLADVGFAYSSSVVPARGVWGGWPDAPRRPFLWPGGVLEIPCPVARIGPLTLPFLGGMYLRYLPSWHHRPMLRQLGGQAAWTYCHPYDIDRTERLARLPGRSGFSSLMLRLNRAPTLRRWTALAEHAAPNFTERLSEWRDGAPVFVP